MPWVRMHAVKDYYDMAAMLKDYPNVHVAFNLVPSLIKQLDSIRPARDIQLILTEKPACELTLDDKASYSGAFSMPIGTTSSRDSLATGSC